MERITIEEATADQLRTFGSTVLGLELGGRENRQAMIAKMTSVGYNMPDIPLPVATEAPTGGPKRDEPFSTRINARGQKEIKIIIHSKDEEGGDRPVQVGVNGKLMLIERGKEQWVPEAYVEVLNHAEENIYSEYSNADGGLGGLKTPRVIKAYPFSYA